MANPTGARRARFKLIPRLLDHIGLAMYSSVPKAISELVANSYDANATEVRINLTSTDGELTSVVIADNGDGMSTDDIEKFYLALGHNKREATRSKANGQRKPIGSKGIGKLAGLGIAKTMEVISNRDGIQTTLTISRDQFEKRDVELSQIEFPVSVARTRKSNGTNVRLRNLLDHARSVQVGDLREFLAAQFGLTKDFKIFVDGQRLTPSDIEGERREIKDTIRGFGTVTGSIVIAKRMKDVKRPGLIVYVRGRAVEGPTLYDINSPVHQFRVANRIIGEVSADFLDPDPPRKMLDGFIIATSREGFLQGHPAYIAFKTWAEHQLRTISRELEKLQAKERIAALEANPSVQKVLRDLPAALRKRFEESIRSLIPTLNNLSDEHAERVVEFISRLAETQSMVAILERLKEADEKDITSLAKLLEDWGIYELASLSTLIKSRLEVIKRFGTIVSDPRAREFPDIHTIIENNLWILDDNYRFYSSNQQMRTMLNAELAKRYAKQKNMRPDFVCRSLLQKHVIVEVKKPSHKITYDDVSQLFGYANILKRNFPNTEVLECFLIGRTFDDTLASREPIRQGTITVSARSFAEIVEAAAGRYQEVLNIFEDESKHGAGFAILDSGDDHSNE